MIDKRDSEKPRPERGAYEPPELVVLGTISGVTNGAVGGSTDAGVLSVVSDRRLKIGLRPVRSDELLAKLAG